MKPNQSFTSSAPTLTAPTAGPRTNHTRPYRIGLAVVATLVVLASGWFVTGTARHTVPAAVAVVASSQLSPSAYIQTLPRQIQAQMAGGGRNAASATVPDTAAQVSQSAYLLTLPTQIQAQVAGRVNTVTAAASPAQPSAFIQTLPRQIQEQMAGRTRERAGAGGAVPSREAYLVTLPRQIQEQMAGPSSRAAGASLAQQSVFILTLPRQIQDQMAGR